MATTLHVLAQDLSGIHGDAYEDALRAVTAYAVKLDVEVSDNDADRIVRAYEVDSELANPVNPLKDAPYEASPVEKFLADVVGHKEGNSVLAVSMYQAYKRWCVENGVLPKLDKEFRVEMERHGLTRKREQYGMFWVDVTLRSSEVR